jgi:hypothetical protein
LESSLPEALRMDLHCVRTIQEILSETFAESTFL